MKKIVALVLAMVMVLGLATTAFAAKMGAGFDAAVNDSGWDYVITLDDAEDAKDQTFATYEIEAVAKKDADVAYLLGATKTSIEKGDDFDVAGTFVKVANEEYSDYTFVDNKTITYFRDAKDLEWTAKAVKVTLPGTPADAGDQKHMTYYNNSPAPGTFYWDAEDEVLYVASKDYAAADADAILNVGGVAVFAVEAEAGVDYVIFDHTYVVNWATRNDGKQYPTKVYCSVCKADFSFIYGGKKDALAAYGPLNYQAVYADPMLGADVLGVYIELQVPVVPGASAATDATDAEDTTVESPKTFDAGIAMYVGMSVMAAAGSAVVLKKKD